MPKAPSRYSGYAIVQRQHTYSNYHKTFIPYKIVDEQRAVDEMKELNATELLYVYSYHLKNEWMDRLDVVWHHNDDNKHNDILVPETYTYEEDRDFVCKNGNLQV